MRPNWCVQGTEMKLSNFNELAIEIIFIKCITISSDQQRILFSSPISIIFVLIFSTEKKKSYWTNKKFVFFFN